VGTCHARRREGVDNEDNVTLRLNGVIEGSQQLLQCTGQLLPQTLIPDSPGFSWSFLHSYGEDGLSLSPMLVWVAALQAQCRLTDRVATTMVAIRNSRSWQSQCDGGSRKRNILSRIPTCASLLNLSKSASLVWALWPRVPVILLEIPNRGLPNYIPLKLPKRYARDATKMRCFKLQGASKRRHLSAPSPTIASNQLPILFHADNGRHRFAKRLRDEVLATEFGSF
jgi:hypothetical protein